MNSKSLFCALGLLTALAGCGSVVQKVQKDIDHAIPSALTPRGLNQSDQVTARPEDLDAAAAQQKTKPVVRRAAKPWFGGSVTEVPNQNLPASLTQHQFMDFGAEPVPPELVFVRLSKLTGLPVRYDNPSKEKKVEAKVVRSPEMEGKSIGSKDQAEQSQLKEWAQSRSKLGGDSTVQMPVEVGAGSVRTAKSNADGKGPPVATESSNTLLMVWSGSTASYLDWVCGQLGLAWYYDGGTIHVSRLKTVTYQLTMASGKQSMRAGTSGASNLESGSGGGGGAGSAGSIATTITSESDQFDATVKAIDALAKTDGGSVFVNQGAGTVVVTTTGPQHVQIRQFVDGENLLAQNRFNISFDIYTVSTTDNEKFGFNPTSLIGTHGKSLFQYTGVNSLGSSAGAGLLKATRTVVGNDGAALTPQTLLLQSLREQGYTVEHIPLSFVTQNAVWDTKMRANTTGYIAEVNSSVSATTPPVITRTTRVATLVTGDTFAAQPTLLADGSVRLNYAITLKTLQAMRNISTDGSSTSVQLQIPEVASIVSSSVVKLIPGESLLLTGLTRRTLRTAKSRLTPDAPLAFGGSEEGKIDVEHLIVLIRVVQI
ncbi:MAG: hypothetical protein QM527_14575 [Alphaproteobacteria bacterium]|nr:hypothetical protein [Alphaproteobacteria bacterium]